MAFLNRFLLWPLWGRAAIVLGLLLLVLLLARVLLEWIVSLLHKLLGGTFERVGNGLAAFGKYVDDRLERWYGVWSKPRSRNPYSALVILAVLACYLYIILPPALHREEAWQTGGCSAYLRAEDAFFQWMEDRGWYTPGGQPDTVPAAGEPGQPGETVRIPLTVYRVSSVLLIRDIPSTAESTALEALSNGAVVNWHGEFAFGPAEGQQEAWVKVTAESGVEGWARLNYLHPEEEIGMSLSVTEVFEAAPPSAEQP